RHNKNNDIIKTTTGMAVTAFRRATMELDDSRQRQRVEKAVAVYSPLMLSVYDLWVYRVAAPRFFRCPTVQFYRFYEQNVSSRHLDIGVGSGLLLRHCLQLGLLGQVALMDLNQ